MNAIKNSDEINEIQEKQTPIISIIVPVYKVEKYLKRCIDSIVNQTYENIEIILVDDGSPDNCGNICDEYAEQYKRIKVIHKENGGQSSARNAGLDVAKGEYIGFVDSDDYIDEEMYEQLMKIALDTDADIVECECRAGKSDNFSVFGKNTRTIEIYNNIESIEKFYFGEQINGIANMVWDKLYKRYLFDNIRFLDGYNRGEDANITPKLLYSSKKIVKYNYNYYNYCIESPDSSSLNENIKKYTDPVVLFEDLRDFWKRNRQTKYENLITIHLLNTLFECRYQHKIRKNKVELIDIDKKINKLINEIENNVYLGEKLLSKIKIYKFSPNLLYYVTKVYKKMKG